MSGVEPSSKHAKLLQDNGSNVYAGSLESFASGQTGSYDIVTCSHVFEHSSDRRDTEDALFAPNFLTPSGRPSMELTLCQSIPPIFTILDEIQLTRSASNRMTCNERSNFNQT